MSIFLIVIIKIFVLIKIFEHEDLKVIDKRNKEKILQKIKSAQLIYSSFKNSSFKTKTKK